MIVIFIMLLRTGSGLKLIPHKLVDGSIQFEGYEKSANKHLFTFKIDMSSETGNHLLKTSDETNEVE